MRALGVDLASTERPGQTCMPRFRWPRLRDDYLRAWLPQVAVIKNQQLPGYVSHHVDKTGGASNLEDQHVLTRVCTASYHVHVHACMMHLQLQASSAILHATALSLRHAPCGRPLQRHVDNDIIVDLPTTTIEIVASAGSTPTCSASRARHINLGHNSTS
jgi:hypothetical protein